MLGGTGMARGRPLGDVPDDGPSAPETVVTVTDLVAGYLPGVNILNGCSIEARKGEDLTGLKADRLVSRGLGFVPQTENVFTTLTIEENMQMGLFQRPRVFRERLNYVTSLPGTGTPAPAASGIPVRG